MVNTSIWAVLIWTGGHWPRYLFSRVETKQTNGLQEHSFQFSVSHFTFRFMHLNTHIHTQVKEVGVIVYNCSCLAEDLDKIFQIYWMLGVPDAVIPPSYPPELETDFNNTDPAKLPLNGTMSQVFFGVGNTRWWKTKNMILIPKFHF